MKNANLTALMLAALLAAGCASRIPPGQTAYVYVADNGVVTFRGEKLKASELPERLRKAGATPKTPILLVAQGDVPSAFLTQMAVACGNAGFPDCAIRERVKVTVEKGTIVQPIESDMHDDRPHVRVGMPAR